MKFDIDGALFLVVPVLVAASVIFLTYQHYQLMNNVINYCH